MALDIKRAIVDPSYRTSLAPADLAEFESMLADEELDRIASATCVFGPTGNTTCSFCKHHLAELRIATKAA